MALPENFSSAVRALKRELGSSPTLISEYWISNSYLFNQGYVQRQWRAVGTFTGFSSYHRSHHPGELVSLHSTVCRKVASSDLDTHYLLKMEVWGFGNGFGAREWISQQFLITTETCSSLTAATDSFKIKIVRFQQFTQRSYFSSSICLFLPDFLLLKSRNIIHIHCLCHVSEHLLLQCVSADFHFFPHFSRFYTSQPK